MIEVKLQRPFIDDNGVEKPKLEKHYAEDENGIMYKVKQVETGRVYDKAIDLIPCKYTYVATDEKVEVIE